MMIGFQEKLYQLCPMLFSFIYYSRYGFTHPLIYFQEVLKPKVVMVVAQPSTTNQQSKIFGIEC